MLPRWVLVLLTLLWEACAPAVAPLATPPSQTVTVQARWGVSSSSLPGCTLRQIIAWRKGEVRFARMGAIGLEISSVVDGRLPDPDFLKRPVGVALLNVIPLDTAAAALDGISEKAVSGTWKLTRLPDGQYAILDIRDTPLAQTDEDMIAIERSQRMAKDLANNDAQTQYNGLRVWCDTRSMAQVPLVLKMLGRTDKVVIPNAIHFDGPRGGGTLPAESTLGIQAVKALCLVTRGLAGSDAPVHESHKSEPDAFIAWWDKVLKTEPFPRLVPATVEAHEVLSLRLNQSWPDLAVSPDGRYAVIGVTRLEQPIDDMKSGICLLDLSPGAKPRWVYRVGSSDVNREPTPLRVGWGSDSVGLVFREPDRLCFMAVDYIGRPVTPPCEIPIMKSANIELAAWSHNWLLIHQTARGAVQALRLDKKGAVVGEAVELAPDFADGRSHFHGGIATVSAVPLEDGAAVAFDGDKGLYLAILNRNLEARTVQVDDPGPPDYARSQPRVAWNGHELLVAWIEEGGNLPQRLFVRTFDRNGKTLSPVRLLADEAVFAAAPVPTDDGFLLAWSDQSISANTIRCAVVGKDGKSGPITAVHQATKFAHPVAAAVQTGMKNILCYDWDIYPHRLISKTLK